jgi:hypothetical protein
MKDKILELLMMQGFTKRKQLLQELQLSGFKVSDRQMRKELETMITKDGYSIQSSEKGYSLIITDAQLTKAIDYLNSKAEAIAIRKNCLIRNFNSGKTHEQLNLFQTL